MYIHLTAIRLSFLFAVATGCLLLTNCSDNVVNKAPVPELPAPVDMATVKPGEVYQKVCTACHGANGEGNPLIQSPAIGALPKWYVKEQIEKFRTGLRGGHPEDTLGILMRSISLNLTPEQIDEVAWFVEKLPEGKTQRHGDTASIDRGRYIFANECMECHRYNGRGEIVFHSAPLVTLDRDYLVRQLKKYRDGWRGTAGNDMYGQKMVNVSQRLNDQKIEDVVNFIGALAHGDDPRPAMEF